MEATLDVAIEGLAHQKQSVWSTRCQIDQKLNVGLPRTRMRGLLLSHFITLFISLRRNSIHVAIVVVMAKLPPHLSQNAAAASRPALFFATLVLSRAEQTLASTVQAAGSGYDVSFPTPLFLGPPQSEIFARRFQRWAPGAM
ncbi:hypothetical protein CEP51_009735 [Fusarium floridanum]|uniref:Uncharacterized protein n=1 Tax=Fusarium floridanum TaxID=1325733 RepID=A0A428RGM4_9HYPO|nr:hypothetical protein CEP51_009735 [Fusarium floridanum]